MYKAFIVQQNQIRKNAVLQQNRVILQQNQWFDQHKQNCRFYNTKKGCKFGFIFFLKIFIKVIVVNLNIILLIHQVVNFYKIKHNKTTMI